VSTPKEKPIRPSLRGERWELWNGVKVTLIQRLSKNMLEVIFDNGMLGALGESEFKKRVDPPVGGTP
jgi:hypothetical protein